MSSPRTRVPSRTARSLLIASAAALMLLLSSGPASAGLGDSGGTETTGGYGASAVSVTVTGNVDPGLQASVPAPPPLCWWEPVSWPGADMSDPKALEEYYYDNIYTSSGYYAAGHYSMPPPEAWEAAIKAVKNGDKLGFYHMRFDESRVGDTPDAANRDLYSKGCGLGIKDLPPDQGGSALVSYAFFGEGDVPEPVIDPEILAEYAYDVMDLPEPTLDWNPKIGAVENASLVNLPTWLWVEDNGAVGERSVTATAATVSVTVTATTGGLSVRSPAGTVDCSPSEARMSYGKGADESAACTLPFSRASWGYPQGFPVDASTDWEASWTSNVGEGGDLDGRTQAATTYIPVAESQATVSDVR